MRPHRRRLPSYPTDRLGDLYGSSSSRLGISHRKLGDRAKALAFYRKALDLEPKHRGANEYLGELYLEMGDLTRAEQRLDVLDSACWFGCEEHSDLEAAIEAYKAK